MGIMQAMFKQFRKPTGWMAKFAALGMNREHEKVWRWGLEHVAIAPDAVVLDVGCGGGGTVKILAQAASRGKVYGVDYSEGVLLTARRVNRALIEHGRVELKYGSVSDLPFPDAAFDLVTAFETTMFWPNLVDALREVRRVLKSGGALLIANEAYADARFEKRNARWSRWTDFQLQTPEETRQCLVEAGYARVEIATLPEKNWIAAIAQK
ncbi:MAG: class I SAM-dependent methyltransferase [Anaerolineae bacterium]|nr:class I SAM-dependent methyltransferase [Anaerolineae bacterium]